MRDDFDASTIADMPISNAKLSAIAGELRDATNLAYASGYYSIARQLSFRADDAKSARFWRATEASLALLPENTPESDNVRSVIAFEKTNPESFRGWFDPKKHNAWIIQPGYENPLDALNGGAFKFDRRNCRAVMAIILDRAAQIILEYEREPTEERYWSMAVSAEAFSDAFLACPDPDLTSDPLLSDFAEMSFELRQVVWAHDEGYWPSRKPRDESRTSNNALELLVSEGSIFTAMKKSDPPLSGGEISQRAAELSDKAIRAWRRGPDNFITKRWNWILRFIESWPD